MYRASGDELRIPKGCDAGDDDDDPGLASSSGEDDGADGAVQAAIGSGHDDGGDASCRVAAGDDRLTFGGDVGGCRGSRRQLSRPLSWPAVADC